MAALKLVKEKGNLNSENDPNQNTTPFYSEEYYLGHYGAVIKDVANYQLLSLYWRDVLFVRRSLDPNSTVLDFGSGVGQVSAALPRSVCFDFNPFALSELRKRSRAVIDDRQNIPRAAFDFVLSSHSLEHSPTPFRDLEEFRQYLRPGGRLMLVLPIEIERKPSLAPDWESTFTRLDIPDNHKPALGDRMDSPCADHDLRSILTSNIRKTFAARTDRSIGL